MERLHDNGKNSCHAFVSFGKEAECCLEVMLEETKVLGEGEHLLKNPRACDVLLACNLQGSCENAVGKGKK